MRLWIVDQIMWTGKVNATGRFRIDSILALCRHHFDKAFVTIEPIKFRLVNLHFQRRSRLAGENEIHSDSFAHTWYSLYEAGGISEFWIQIRHSGSTNFLVVLTTRFYLSMRWNVSIDLTISIFDLFDKFIKMVRKQTNQEPQHHQTTNQTVQD